jgi:deoxyribodipyrimidine photo-lyase
MIDHTSIHWFRQDLRLIDNPALSAAAKIGDVLPVYILDDQNAGDSCMGGASRWWLHNSLLELNKSLDGNLCILEGDPKELITELAIAIKATGVYWNRCYEPWRINRDKFIKADLIEKGISVESHNGSLLWEPWEISKADGTPYKVFTPFYRKGCLNAESPRRPLPAPKLLQTRNITTFNIEFIERFKNSITHLNLLPTKRWHEPLGHHWNIGENAAHDQLEKFLTTGISNYKEGRNFPSKPYVSRLSSHLHWGEISPNSVWYATKNLNETSKNIDHFLSEIGWREFSYSLLYHFPDLPTECLQPKFINFPWQNNPVALKRWQQGQTGFPIVDAGMRELWQTGYMHNRVRMIVASFLVKNLLIHWHHGEAWFWDTLVDADLANNSASWQWVAGCGADAAPYFRIFNPITQSERFDSEGIYIRKYIPELTNLPNKYLFAPWEAPSSILTDAGILIGTNYPEPLCDLKISREAALTAFSEIKQNI